MAMIIAGIFLIVVALVGKGAPLTVDPYYFAPVMGAMLVGGFVWIAAGVLLQAFTSANEKKAKSLDNKP
jgi:hypothetical protein